MCVFGNKCIQLLQSHRARSGVRKKTNNALVIDMAICVCSVLHVLLSGGYPLEMNGQSVCADYACNKCHKVAALCVCVCVRLCMLMDGG